MLGSDGFYSQTLPFTHPFKHPTYEVYVLLQGAQLRKNDVPLALELQLTD